MASIKRNLSIILLSISTLANCAAHGVQTRKEEKIIQEHKTTIQVISENQKLLNETAIMIQNLTLEIAAFKFSDEEEKIKLFQKISNDIAKIEKNLEVLEKKGVDTRTDRLILNSIKKALEAE